MEIEAKFDILTPSQVRSFRQMRRLFGHRLGEVEEVTHRDFYFDSTAFRLLRHGLSLRLRQRGQAWIATVKSLGNSGSGAIHNRQEIEAMVGYGFAYEPPAELDSTLLPSEIRAALHAILPESTPLHPFCHLEQRRSKRLLFPLSTKKSGTADAPLAELSIDQVRILPMVILRRVEEETVATEDATNSLKEFDELELELLAENEDAWFSAFSAQLQEMPSLRPSHKSKFERALRSLREQLRYVQQDWAQQDASALTEVNALTTSVAEFCRAIWLEQLLAMVSQEHGVRNNDAEAIHQMRVAIRRMRAAATLFSSHFQSSAIKVFLKRMRKTASLLGHARDLDVALERLEPTIKERSGVEHAELRALAALWKEERLLAHDALLAWLNSEKYQRVLAKLLKFCQSPGEGMREAATGEVHEVRHRLPVVLLEQMADVRAFETALLEQKVDVPIETLHELRIQCKYLRYALEFSEPFLGLAGKRLIAQLKKLQEHLGNLNDAAVSESMLKSLPLSGELSAVANYLHHQQKIIQHERQAVLETLDEFLAPSQRRLFFAALAKL